MKRVCGICFFFCLLANSVWGKEAPTLSKEALAFKRIAALRKDQELRGAKQQLISFLAKYPSSPLKEQALAMLGDIYLQEKNYQGARSAYAEITAEPLIRATLFNRLYALFFLKEYTHVGNLAASSLKEGKFSKEEEIKLHYLLAESLFRQASLASDPALQHALFQEAKPHYAALSHSSYGNEILYSLAEIARLEKDYPKASSLYLILADKYPDKSEELLFQAATMHAYFDKAQAARTFAKTAALKGDLAPSALYNQLTLLFEVRSYEEVLLFPESALPKDKIPLFHFYKAESSFALGDYEKASQYFLKFLSFQTESSSHAKVAIYNLASCAEQMLNPDLFETALSKLHTFFPEEKQLLKWEIEHARLSLQKHLEPRPDTLKTILYSSAPEEEKKTALLDFAQLLFYYKKWEEAQKVWQTLIKTYPQDAKRADMWRHFLQCAFEQKKSEKIIAYLTEALEEKALFPSQEEKELRQLLGSLLYENKRYQEALLQLERSQEGNDLLIALCHLALSPASSSFIDHAEKALPTVLEPSQQHMLHLHLFNAYLSTDAYEKAAEHLFLALPLSKEPIKEENQRWLAEYYYGSARKDSISLERACVLFEMLSPKTLSPSCEEELLKLAELYTLQGAFKKKLSLLETLTKAQQENAHVAWKYQRFALFELAQTYEALEKKQEALSLYEQLIQTSTHTSSYIAHAASLQRSRLLLSTLGDEERQENSPAIQEILSSLKDLQLKKQYFFEPLHLEAALEYIEIKTSLEPLDTRAQKKLFLLQRMKEDFISEEDLLHREYHRLRHDSPEKAQLFEQYMHYIDAQIFHTEALLADLEHHEEKTAELKNKATSELNVLLNSKNLLPAPLLQRTEKTALLMGPAN